MVLKVLLHVSMLPIVDLYSALLEKDLEQDNATYLNFLAWLTNIKLIYYDFLMLNL